MKQNDIPAPQPAPAARSRQELVPEAAVPPRSAGRGRAASDGRGSTSLATANAPALATVTFGDPPETAELTTDVLYEASEDTEKDDALKKKRSEDKSAAALAESEPEKQETSLEEQLIQEEPTPVPAAAVAELLIDPNDTPSKKGTSGPGAADGHAAPVRSRKRLRGESAGAATPQWDESDLEMPREIGDRLHRVAVVAHLFLQDLRQPKMKKTGLLPPVKPKSKADCQRRCGSDGFCDPTDPLGCGGVYCGKSGDMLY